MSDSPKAYSYIRFSTPEQLKGDSLRRQLELSERYAKENKLELDTSLSLRDLGLSAYHEANVEKGALGAFLRAIEDGRVKKGSFLLVESLDRLSRANVLDAQRQFQDIVMAGITIVTLADGMVYSEESLKANFGQMVYSLVIMARAHEESAMKAKRLQAVWDRKKQEAPYKLVTSVVPSWLEAKEGKLLIVEEKAAIVREIFRLVRAGYGVQLIETKFNAESVPPIGRAQRWHRTYILKILHNRAVIGEYQPMSGRGKERHAVGDPVSNYYPAIITEEEFYATQGAIQVRTTKGGRKGERIANIFSGLCRCGYCGGPMRYVNKNTKTNWQYLVCSNAKAGLGCKHVPWNYNEFQNTVLMKLAGLDIGTVLQDQSVDQAKAKLDARSAKLTETRKALRNLIRIAEAAEDVEEITTRIGELKATERILHHEVRELDEQAKLPSEGRKHFEQFQRLKKSMADAEEDELSDLRLRISHELKRLLDRIEIFPEGSEPWSFSMMLIGVAPGKSGRFAVAVFKSGDGRVLHGVNSSGTIWPGPKTDEGVASAHRFPFAKPVTDEAADTTM